MTAPKYESDGYRTEKCVRCGEVIGYGFFDAREYVVGNKVVVDFTHRDRMTFDFTCERTGQ